MIKEEKLEWLSTKNDIDVTKIEKRGKTWTIVRKEHQIEQGKGRNKEKKLKQWSKQMTAN